MNIYVITNLLNNKQYVGREKVYSPEYYGSGKLIKESIEKHGKQNFRKEILIGNRDIETWEKCSYLEAVCKLSFNSIIPNGYNKTCWEYPMSIETCREAGKISGKQNKELKRGIFDPKYADKIKLAGKINGKRIKELGKGIFDPKYADKIKLARSNGGKKLKEEKRGLFDPKYKDKFKLAQKKNGKIVGEQNKELKRGWFALGMQSKAGKKGGKKSYELKIGCHAPGNLGKGGKISGKKNYELKIGCHALGMQSKAGKKGGKLHAHAVFEMDGIFQQMTLGRLLEL